MKKFVVVMFILVMAVTGFTGCCAEGCRYETDERVSYDVVLPQDGNAVEYIYLGKAFTFEVEHYDDGTASLVIWRHVEGEDSEWLNYFCTGHWDMEDTPYMPGLRSCIEANLDFCLEVMDRHGWA